MSKIKIGTLIDEQIFHESKEFAARKGLAFNEFLEMALQKYLEDDSGKGLLSLEDVLDADPGSHSGEGSGQGAGNIE